MSELITALRRLLNRRPKPGSRRDPLDRERAASMADEGGAAGAEVEAQPTLARPVGSVTVETDEKLG
jgi:hypothetical protein